jgi:hypothetical protein
MRPPVRGIPMNRSRLLLALPAATALVLAGGSPALAGGDGHSDNDTWAKVIEINDEAELEDEGELLKVTFEYKCEEEDEDSVTADVVAENKDEDLRYEADDVNLDCNGEKNEITVDLERDEDSEKAEEGDKVDVTVTINENGDELDSKTKEDVEVVDEENGDKGNGDKGNGGNDDNGKHDSDEHNHDGH